MRKKGWITGAALLATAALLLFFPLRERAPERAQGGVRIIRVWLAEKEPAVGAWLRKCAAAYEKETGERVYLRAATQEEAQAALSGQAGVVPPDLLIAPELEMPLALRGCALIVADAASPPPTPAPTSALFYRPSPSPGPAATPPPAPTLDSLSGLLAAAEWAGVYPGAQISADPARDFDQGLAQAALLTPGQTAGLSRGYRAYAPPEGRGFLPVQARALSAAGERLLAQLQSEGYQRRLQECGLFSYQKGLRLYGEEDALRALLESARP